MKSTKTKGATAADALDALGEALEFFAATIADGRELMCRAIYSVRNAWLSGDPERMLKIRKWLDECPIENHMSEAGAPFKDYASRASKKVRVHPKINVG